MISPRKLLVTALAIAATACTDADLWVDMDARLANAHNQSEVELCVPDPVEEAVPYKVLFVIDTSGSNSWTDPTPPNGQPRRERAVRDAITEHIESANVSFGVVTFSDQPRRQTFGFTRDLTVLNGAMQNIANAQGGTNYSDSLWTTIDFLREDVEAAGADEAARSNYIVYWLSDGYPTVGVTDPRAIVPGVSQLCADLGPRVAGLTFNTAFLGGQLPAGTPEGDAMMAAARDLLRGMANACDGSFVDIPGGQSFAFEIDPAPIIHHFKLTSFAASNHHVRVGDLGPEADSDADGLTDSRELSDDLDPENPDSDDDGVRDGLEAALKPLRHPRFADALCPDKGIDSDADGLYDCEELAYGTDLRWPDSDGDFLPDGFEALTGGLPLSGDATQDSDLDGTSDVVETRAHLPSRDRTEPADAERWGYGYVVEELPYKSPSGTKCYRLAVNNIAVRETRETAVSQRGTNLIELHAVFTAEDGEADPRFFRAARPLRFILPDVRDPAAGVLEFRPADFALMQTE